MIFKKFIITLFLFLISFQINYSENNIWKSIGIINNQNISLQIKIDTLKSINKIESNTNGYLFASSLDYHFFRSSNKGETWEKYPFRISYFAIDNIGDIYFADYLKQYIARTTDNGNNWDTIFSPYNNNVGPSVISIGNGTIMTFQKNIINNTFKLMRTVNYGNYWDTVRDGFSNDEFYYSNSGYYFARYFQYVHRSNKVATSWQSIMNPDYGSKIDLAFDSSYHIYVIADAGTYSSSDNGTSWRKVNNIYANGITVNLSNHIFISTDSGVFRSTNSGLDWSAFNSGLPTDSMTSLCADQQGYIYTATKSHGVFRTLETTILLPSTPVLELPINGEQNQYVESIFQWYGVGSSKYHLQIAYDSLFESLVLDDSNVTARKKHIGPLQPLTLYYWRVKGKNFLGESEFSSHYHFTTSINPPAIPLLLFPENASINQPTSLTFIWDSATNADKYHIQVSTDSFFQFLRLNDSNITTHFRTLSGLLNLKTYYWRVRSKNFGGPSLWSAYRNFTTTYGLPNQPTLIYPPPERLIRHDTVSFTWNITPYNVVKYWFEIDTNQNFPNAVRDSNLTDTTKIMSGFVSAQLYWWRVRAKNEFGWGMYSDKRRFFVLLLDINEVNNLPKQFSLEQNYPNPFNPITTLKYQLPHTVFVTVKVYDILGGEVSTLVNESQSAGYKSVQFDARTLSSGLYFYKLTAGTFSETKKMVILK
jgi:hypothetical protein